MAANGLKILSDGLILKSQAHLAAGLAADWSAAHLATCRRLLTIFEARARGKAMAHLTWPPAQDIAARVAVSAFTNPGAAGPAHAVLIETSKLFAATAALGAAGIGPVSVAQPAYVFEADCPAADRLSAALGAVEF